MKEMIKEIAEKLQPDLLRFCQDIIKTPSLSGEEGAVADLFAAEMKKLGYDEVFIDDWGNVIGIVRGFQKGPVIMYNGHMDVVGSGDTEEWDGYEPFGAQIDEALMEDAFADKEEKVAVIHGRGSADLKCNLASQVYAGGILAEMKRRGVGFAGNFLLTAVVLEENGEMMGTLKLCEETLPAHNMHVDAMVCCEPSSMKLMLGHRGRMEIKVVVKGRSCHGSSPWLGINAVEKSAELIRRVHKMIWSKTDKDPHIGRPGIALTMFTCEPNELCVVPDKCTIIYDRRLIPGETTQSAVAEIQQIADRLSEEDPDFAAEVSINKNFRKAYTGKSAVIESSKEVWMIDRNHPFIQACGDALKELGEPIAYDYWSFSTDTPQLGTRMQKPVIGYGPGQEYVIHTPKEKVRLDYLKRSLPAYAAMYIKASRLPPEAFHA